VVIFYATGSGRSQECEGALLMAVFFLAHSFSRHPQLPKKEEVGRPHGRSAQLQALPKGDGSARREKQEGTQGVLLLM